MREKESEGMREKKRGEGSRWPPPPGLEADLGDEDLESAVLFQGFGFRV
jgi:hypothetical protein